MQQHVLDPADTPVGKDWTPQGPTPPEFRQFRRFPDIEKWLPGDLILVNEVQPDTVAKATIAIQRKGFDEKHARWHHAAIYVGDGLSICEATREGIRVALLYKYCGQHRLRIRRAPKIDLNTRWKIVVASLVRLNTPYSYERAVHVLTEALGGYKRPSQALSRDQGHCICSGLFADAYSIATGLPLVDKGGFEITPAFLSSTSALDDVQSSWLTMP